MGSGQQSLLNIQPVIPFSISPDWNVISRTIIPLIDQEDLAPGSRSEQSREGRAAAADRKVSQIDHDAQFQSA